MNQFLDSFLVFDKAKSLVEIKDYLGTINYIKNNIKFIKEIDDVAISCIICGFISYKLSDYACSIEFFSSAILHEQKSDFISKRSKDIAYCGRSNSKYKNGDYKGSIEDKRVAKKIRLSEENTLPLLNGKCIDYKSITLESFDDSIFENKYKLLSKISKIKKRKYDLIEDYKKVLNNKKRYQIIKKLENLSDEKYNKGDFKASCNALRRAEKYW
ncbi:hypothetical protein [Prochlorococcus marinus]|uniref:hypothetical protein n=1 Tax=Prochlorococcus marinus TaxID=1219 RepID=UPI0039AFD9C4